MPIDPTRPGAGAPVPKDTPQPVAVPQAPAAAPDPANGDPASARDLATISQGGKSKRWIRPDGSLSTQFLGNALGDLGALLRSHGVDMQVPGVSPELIQLPSRGGVMVKTTAGWIQLGLPMWTNKDIFASFLAQQGHLIPKEELASKMPHMVPQVLIVDTDFVDHVLGTDFAQFMFFVTKGTQFTIVAPDAETAAKIERFLSLSYEGPRSAELSASVAAEYPAGSHGVPDMMAELTRGFGNSPPLHVLRKVTSLDERGEYSFATSNVTIRKVGPMQYEIIDAGQSLGVVNLKDYPVPKPAIQIDPELQEARQKALIEGRPGLWAIGTGHGFVPNEETSGFIIFGQGPNGSGKIILVDPPSSTPEYLLAHGIPLEAVEGVILTHGHTDHYGDAVPKLLRNMPQVKIYTTPTIQKMLQEQYELGVGGKREGLTQWNFVPVQPQTFMEIVGLNFRFEYGFHTVPTIGFDLYDKPDLAKGKCIAFFTGDTFADYAEIWPHTKEGPNKEAPVMSVQRALNVTRHYAHLMASKGQQPPIVGLVEGGFPPIHTPPVSTRNLLEAAAARGIDVRNVRVYHIDQKTANDTGVPKWQAGPKGFIDLSPAFPDFIPTTEVEYAARILDKMPLLDALGTEMKAAILKNGELKKVPAGTELIHDGVADAHDRKFFFLIDGEVQVSKGETVITSRPNGLFGEGALLGRERNATVTTTVPSFVLEVDVMDLPPRVSAPLKSVLQQVRHHRNKAYDTIKNHSPLGILPDSILDVLFMRPKTFTIQDGFTFIQEGAMDRDVYVVLDGQVRVTNESQTVHEVLGKGAMLGEMALVDGKPRAASVTAVGDVTVIKWAADVLQSLGTKYPGIAIAMGRTAVRREAENGAGIRVTVTPGKGEAGFATPDVLLTPVYAAKRGADFLDEITPAVMKNTLRGGLVFLLGDQLSEMALGKFHKPDVKSLAVDYTALTAGGRVGELGLQGTLSLKMAQQISAPVKAMLSRAVPLFSALITQELVHNGKVDLAQLPVSAGNVLAASGIVSATTAALATSERLSTLGKVLRLVSVGGKATLLGAVVTTAAEFLIIKQLNAIEMQLQQAGAVQKVLAHVSSLLRADHLAIETLAAGGAVPMSYFNAIDAQLAEYEKSLATALNVDEQQVLTDAAQARANLKDWYAAKTAKPLDGTWSFSEVDALYRERLAAIEKAKSDALAKAAVPKGDYSPLPVDPQGSWSQFVDAVDEDDLKADVDMDGNPVRDDTEMRYQGMLAHDWKTLSAQIAQYRKDRAAVIEKYLKQLPPKVMPIELAMN